MRGTTLLLVNGEPFRVHFSLLQSLGGQPQVFNFGIQVKRGKARACDRPLKSNYS